MGIRALQNVTIVVLFFSCALVLLGSLNMPQESSAGLPNDFEIIKVSEGGESILVDLPAGGPWNGIVNTADCTAAAAGASGISDVVIPHPAWKASLDDFPAADWISDNPLGSENPPGSSSFLIAVPFSVDPDSFEVLLDFDFLSDNFLGDAFNAGLFINCSPIFGSTVTSTGLFAADNFVGPFDITSLLNGAGTSNTLFILSINAIPGTPGGIQYGATISVDTCPPGTVPPDCESPLIGGEFLGVDSTALILVGAQMNAVWMIPVIVSAIGIGIVIARKF